MIKLISKVWSKGLILVWHVAVILRDVIPRSWRKATDNHLNIVLHKNGDDEHKNYDPTYEYGPLEITTMNDILRKLFIFL